MIKISDLEPAILMRSYLRGHYQIVDRLLNPVDPINFIHRVHALQMHPLPSAGLEVFNCRPHLFITRGLEPYRLLRIHR